MEIPPFHFRILILVIFWGVSSRSQDHDSSILLSKRSKWSVTNAHSHNDYQQIHPFTTAYQAQFGSMEADILLFHDSLFVGHRELDIQNRRLFTSLYLDSIRFYLKMHAGGIFAEKNRTLQLLIDIKTDAEPTLDALIHELEKYPDLINSTAVSFVITGNRPSPEKWSSYPRFIWFDGNAGIKYDSAILRKIVMISGNFASFSSWKGNGNPDTAVINQLSKIIIEAHDQGKKIRFWNAPDNPQSWQLLISLGVDWINTDHIQALAGFLGLQQ